MKKPLSSIRTTHEWQTFAEVRLKKILIIAQSLPTLVRLGPSLRSISWSVEVGMVSRIAMTRLNDSYRGKSYPTDILSFPTVEPFRATGLLGELIICLAVLKAQARTLNHSADVELDVLLVHGVLHLLGLDHEQGHRQAIQMARWEGKILSELYPKKKGKELLGLIDRVYTGKEQE